jgi:hypothetical protein
MLKTLWIQYPAFVKQCAFWEAKFIPVPGHPTSCTCKIGSQESRTKTFSLHKFSTTTMQATWFLQVQALASTFKRLVLGTTLWQHIKMTTILNSPGGLKDSECKRCGACQCGTKSNTFSLILRLCCGTFFTYSDPDWQVTSCETAQKAQTTFQTPSPWWQSRPSLQWHGFDESTPPEGWASLHFFFRGHYWRIYIDSLN